MQDLAELRVRGEFDRFNAGSWAGGRVVSPGGGQRSFSCWAQSWNGSTRRVASPGVVGVLPCSTRRVADCSPGSQTRGMRRRPIPFSHPEGDRRCPSRFDPSGVVARRQGLAPSGCIQRGCPRGPGVFDPRLPSATPYGVVGLGLRNALGEVRGDQGSSTPGYNLRPRSGSGTRLAERVG